MPEKLEKKTESSGKMKKEPKVQKTKIQCWTPASDIICSNFTIKLPKIPIEDLLAADFCEKIVYRKKKEEKSRGSKKKSLPKRKTPKEKELKVPVKDHFVDELHTWTIDEHDFFMRTEDLGTETASIYRTQGAAISLEYRPDEAGGEGTYRNSYNIVPYQLYSPWEYMKLNVELKGEEGTVVLLTKPTEEEVEKAKDRLERGRALEQKKETVDGVFGSRENQHSNKKRAWEPPEADENESDPKTIRKKARDEAQSPLKPQVMNKEKALKEWKRACVDWALAAVPGQRSEKSQELVTKLMEMQSMAQEKLELQKSFPAPVKELLKAYIGLKNQEPPDTKKRACESCQKETKKCRMLVFTNPQLYDPQTLQLVSDSELQLRFAKAIYACTECYEAIQQLHDVLHFHLCSVHEIAEKVAVDVLENPDTSSLKRKDNLCYTEQLSFTTETFDLMYNLA